jgi:hypothetical protein
MFLSFFMQLKFQLFVNLILLKIVTIAIEQTWFLENSLTKVATVWLYGTTFFTGRYNWAITKSTLLRLFCPAVILKRVIYDIPLKKVLYKLIWNLQWNHSQNIDLWQPPLCNVQEMFLMKWPMIRNACIFQKRAFCLGLNIQTVPFTQTDFRTLHWIVLLTPPLKQHCSALCTVRFFNWWV